MGRPRSQSIAIRFTDEEAKRIADAAAKRGLTVREWAREVMLEAAGSAQTDTPIFTELLALSMLMNGVPRELALGRTMTPEHQALVTEVKKSKHDVARDVLTRYQANEEGRTSKTAQ